MLKPTPKLRYIQRVEKISLEHDTYTFRMIKYLQQWWADYSVDIDTNHLVEFNGEWRDVPLETEEVK